MPAGRRVLSQSISTDPRYSRLHWKGKILYPLLWVNADDQGRLPGNPDKIKLAVCPSVPEIASEDIPGLLEEMADPHQGLIIYYTTSKTPAIQITDWWEVESPQWAWPSQYEPPPGWTDHLRYKRGRKEVVTVNWPPHSGECSPETNDPEPESLNPPPGGRHSGECSGDIRPTKTQTQTQTQTQDSTLRGEQGSPRTTHKLRVYSQLNGARDSPRKQVGILARFCRDYLCRPGGKDPPDLYAQVAAMLKRVPNPFELFSHCILTAFERHERGPPLVDPMPFVWALVNDKVQGEHSGKGEKA